MDGRVGILNAPVREDPFELTPPTFGHCPFGGRGGGLNACLDGLGPLFREELSKFNWAFPCFLGGSKRLRGWFEASIYGYNGVFNEFSEKLPKCRVHHRLWVFLKDEFTVHQYKPHSKDK